MAQDETLIEYTHMAGEKWVRLEDVLRLVRGQKSKLPMAPKPLMRYDFKADESVPVTQEWLDALQNRAMEDQATLATLHTALREALAAYNSLSHWES